jgi:hypothetical protein
MTIESILDQCSIEGVKLSFDLTGTLDVRCIRKKISYNLREKLKLNKPEIINYLSRITPPPSSTGNNKNFTDILVDSVDSVDIVESSKGVNNTDIGSVEPIRSEPCFPWVNLSFKDLVEKITMYRSVLEQTYFDDDHDDWHGDGMPQKFRASDHTYDEMKIALARFIQRVHGHEAEVVAAVIAFEKSQETLLEHQEYLKIQKMFPICNTPQLKEQSELAWQDCMRAYKKLPEYKVLMSAKKRQCLFDPLMDKQPSKEHIQDLVNSLATS